MFRKSAIMILIAQAVHTAAWYAIKVTLSVRVTVMRQARPRLTSVNETCSDIFCREGQQRALE